MGAAQQAPLAGFGKMGGAGGGSVACMAREEQLLRSEHCRWGCGNKSGGEAVACMVTHGQDLCSKPCRSSQQKSQKVDTACCGKQGEWLCGATGAVACLAVEYRPRLCSCAPCAWCWHVVHSHIRSC
eukprot:365898-Chlamydomonas_euryale.AAC.6